MFGWRSRAATCASRWKRCLTSSSMRRLDEVLEPDQLDGDVAAEHAVVGAVHLAEGARAEARDDAVALAEQARERRLPGPARSGRGDLKLGKLVGLGSPAPARSLEPATRTLPAPADEGCKRC